MTSVEIRGCVPSSAGFLFMMLMSVSGARTRKGLPPGEASSYGALRAVSGVWGNAPERRRGVPFISCRGGGSNPHGLASTGAQRADRKRAGGWIVGGQGAVRCVVLMRLRCPAKLFASCPELAFWTRRRAESSSSSLHLHHAHPPTARFACCAKLSPLESAQDAAFCRLQFTCIHQLCSLPSSRLSHQRLARLLLATMATRASKRRKTKTNGSCSNGLLAEQGRVFPNDASVAATAGDKRKWQGFCEIENDPVCSTSGPLSWMSRLTPPGILQRHGSRVWRSRRESSRGLRLGRSNAGHASVSSTYFHVTKAELVHTESPSTASSSSSATWRMTSSSKRASVLTTSGSLIRRPETLVLLLHYSTSL